MNKTDQLQILNTRMILECPCKLRETATQAVPGEGNADADIMFVGEAPGKNEDLQGKPFIGSAGKFLAEMLSSINLQREDTFITNIVKYRPPENRDPEPTEITDCMPWLHEQIAIIQPKIIVTLGRHALEHFIPGKKYLKFMDRPFDERLMILANKCFLPSTIQQPLSTMVQCELH